MPGPHRETGDAPHLLGSRFFASFPKWLSYRPISSGGCGLKETLDFLDRIQGTPGGTRGTNQAALRETVESGGAYREGLGGLEPV
jgi:hypothetical protein